MVISGRERRFAWVAFVVLVAVCLNTGEVSASLTEASQCTKARTTSEFACQDGLDEMCTVAPHARNPPPFYSCVPLPPSSFLFESSIARSAPQQLMCLL